MISRLLSVLFVLLLLGLSPSAFADDEVEQLRRQLQDPHPKTRLRALKGLGKLSSHQAKPAFKDLLRLSIWDKDRSNRFEAYLVARHLESDPKKIIVACLEAYISEEAALSWSRGQRNLKWLPSLKAMAKRQALGSDIRPDSNDFIAMAAIKALGDYGQLAAPVVAVLRDRIDTTAIGEEAMKTLGKIGPAARSAVPKLVEEFERAYTGRSSKGAGYYAFAQSRMNHGCIAMLKGIGDPAASALAALFLKKNEQPYRPLRSVLKAYDRTGTKLVPSLMKLFDGASDAQLRRFTLELSEMNSWLPGLKTSLRARLISDSPAQKRGAAIALGLMNELSKESEAILLESVQARDAQAFNSALILGRMSKELKWAIPILIEEFLKGSFKAKGRSEEALLTLKRAGKGRESFSYLLSHPHPKFSLAAAYFLPKKQAKARDLEKANRILLAFILRRAKVKVHRSWGSVHAPDIDLADAQFAIAEAFPRSEALLKIAIKAEVDPDRRRALLLVYACDPDRTQRIKRARDWLLSQKDPLLRLEMAYLLSREKDALRETLPSLAQALEDSDGRVRASVRHGISQSSAKEVVPILVKALDSPLEENRDFAQARLIALKSLKLITNKHLAPLRNSPKPHLGSAAKIILDALFKKL